MKIYLIRHGQSESNAKKLQGGWDQSHLTDRGREHAAIAKKRLEGLRFDKVYSSDLNRTIETQQIAYPCDDVVRCELVREINVGDLMGQHKDKNREKYGERYLINRNVLDFSDYGGESYDQFKERILKFLKMLEESQDETVAVFCHGGWIHMMLDIVSGVKIYDKLAFKCTNCGVYIFEYDGNKWHLDTWNYKGDIQ